MIINISTPPTIPMAMVKPVESPFDMSVVNAWTQGSAYVELIKQFIPSHLIVPQNSLLFMSQMIPITMMARDMMEALNREICINRLQSYLVNTSTIVLNNVNDRIGINVQNMYLRQFKYPEFYAFSLRAMSSPILFTMSLQACPLTMSPLKMQYVTSVAFSHIRWFVHMPNMGGIVELGVVGYFRRTQGAVTYRMFLIALDAQQRFPNLTN